MADISQEIDQLRNAVYGEEVRGAFISCMQKIHEENESYNRMQSRKLPQPERHSRLLQKRLRLRVRHSRLQSRKLQRPVKHSRQLYRMSLILQNRLTQRSSNL